MAERKERMIETSATAIKRAVGRPRRLTIDAIVDAACEIGIAGLEMGQVAERLNTGVATLYGYVRCREHLLQLVAERMASNALERGCGGSWQDILRKHAALCYAMFQSMPELIGNLIGGQANDQEVAYAENLVAMLEARGLTRSDAIDAFIETNQAVIGAAVMLVRRKVLANVSIDEEGNTVPLPTVLGDYGPTLDRIIKAYQEKLGPALSGGSLEVPSNE